jgi:hypothetical protein
MIHDRVDYSLDLTADECVLFVIANEVPHPVFGKEERWTSR